jgi:nitric oxide dioxygenase
VVSGWLHDKAAPGTALRAAPPAGEFFLRQALARPVVLVSGGVGLTPMMSMLETIAERHPGLPAHYVHGTRDGATHAMGARARELAARSGGAIKVATFYERPRPEDRHGLDYDEEGLISVEWLGRNTPMQEADYFLCGPRAFLRKFVGGLAQEGVASGRIHYEFFGPADELLAA